MNAITNFLSHYMATYTAYLASPNVWIACAVYLAFMTLAIIVMAKLNKFENFVTVLFSAITVLSFANAYTFVSLW